MDKFACEIELEVSQDISLDNGEPFHDYDNVSLVSTIPDLHSMCDLAFDLFDQLSLEEPIRSLPNGLYHVFVSGIVGYERSIDWETGIDEGGWIFEWKNEDVHIAPLKL